MKKFIVVGAGILGASTAYHLAKAGEEVMVIDRHDPGQATDAAAGIICPWLSQRRNKAWYALAKSGTAYYASLIDQLKRDGETDTGYQKTGAISVHHEAGKLDKMSERAVKRREEAPEIGEIQRLSAKETKESFPPLSQDFSSVYVSGAARVNGRALRQALLNAARRHGATVVNESAELEYTKDQVIGVRTASGRYEADRVIVTAGAWAAELLAPLGLSFQLTSQKAQIVHLQLNEMQTGDWPVVMPPNDQYIVAFEEGKIVIGATHEEHVDFDRQVTAGGLHEIFDKALSVAPGLASGTFIEARVGFRPFTPNFLPVIGEVPGCSNLLLANGLGASGLTVGPFLGAQLAKLAFGHPVDIDLSLYELGVSPPPL